MYAEKRKCTLKKSICTHGVIFFYFDGTQAGEGWY